jgi:PPOX class probable F420-dependent enzyme
MASLPIHPPFEEILRRPNPAVLACVRPNGTPHSCAAWYLWEGDRVVLTFGAKRKRLEFIRLNPAASLTVLDHDDWVRSVTLFGRVNDVRGDTDLSVADRCAQHYFGTPYPDRESRRVAAVLEIDSWFGWDAYERVTNLKKQRGGA